MLDWGFLCLFGTYCYSVLLLLHLTFFSVTVWVQMHLFQNIKYVPNVRVVPVSLSRDIIKTWSFSFNDGPEPTFVKMIQEQHRHADMRLCFTLQIHSADTLSPFSTKYQHLWKRHFINMSLTWGYSSLTVFVLSNEVCTFSSAMCRALACVLMCTCETGMHAN